MLQNAGANLFLPAGVDFSTARIVSRKGRDLATLWAEAEGCGSGLRIAQTGATTTNWKSRFGQ